MHTGTALTAVAPREAGLLERCKAGDRQAWREFHEAQYVFVHRVARRFGTPTDEVDDVCQDVFVIAFRKIHTFRYGNLETWLYRITTNIVSSRHRRRRVREAVTAALAAFDFIPRDRTPLREVERRDREAAVASILQRMSPAKREVFALADLEELSAEEISERVGCTVPTVRTRLHRARKEFERIARKRGLLP